MLMLAISTDCTTAAWRGDCVGGPGQAGALAMQGRAEDLDALLLESALASIASAIEAIESGDGEACTSAVSLTSEIVGQLYLGLSHVRSEDARSSLGQIYNFVLRQLPTLRGEYGAGRARQIRTLLEPLRRTFPDCEHLAGANA
jgi:flagellin-specific chaperone FliS